MVLELNNSTVSSVDDRGDLSYASFDFFPKYSAQNKYVFKGMLFSRGVNNGRKCVVKLKRDCATLRPEDWESCIVCAKSAQNLAIIFNQNYVSSGYRLKFRVPFTSLMDTIASTFSIRKHILRFLGKKTDDCKPRKNEYVLVEKYIRGNFNRLNANNGWMSPNQAYCELQAFAHFTWCYSAGSLIVAEMQGVKTNTRYLLTNPIIHSRDGVFGSSDRGQNGIDEFFQRHRCNYICEGWNNPASTQPMYLINNACDSFDDTYCKASKTESSAPPQQYFEKQGCFEPNCFQNYAGETFDSATEMKYNLQDKNLIFTPDFKIAFNGSCHQIVKNISETGMVNMGCVMET